MKNKSNLRWWQKMAQGFLLVLSGPSGAGKGTVSEAQMKLMVKITFLFQKKSFLKW